MVAAKAAAPARVVSAGHPWKEAKAKHPKKPGESAKVYGARIRALLPWR